MDCQTARLLLELSPTCREINGDEGEALGSHLADCSDCGTFAQRERRFHSRMTQAMQAVATPEGLHVRLLARLRAEREDRYRRWFGHGMRAALAAAALVLVSWVVWSLFQSPTPNLNLETAHQWMAIRYDSVNKEQVEQWFAQTYHITTLAPDQFNYRYLIHYDLADFEGKRVPMLVFTNSQATARVFVVTAKEFNLNALPAGRISSGGCTVEVWHKPGSAYAYVIVYTGDTIDPLLEKNDKPSA